METAQQIQPETTNPQLETEPEVVLTAREKEIEMQLIKLFAQSVTDGIFEGVGR